jgi:hypothetical protein
MGFPAEDYIHIAFLRAVLWLYSKLAATHRRPAPDIHPRSGDVRRHDPENENVSLVISCQKLAFRGHTRSNVSALSHTAAINAAAIAGTDEFSQAVGVG